MEVTIMYIFRFSSLVVYNWDVFEKIMKKWENKNYVFILRNLKNLPKKFQYSLKNALYNVMYIWCHNL